MNDIESCGNKLLIHTNFYKENVLFYLFMLNFIIDCNLNISYTKYNSIFSGILIFDFKNCIELKNCVSKIHL
jgi:hypothetical protein